MQDDKIATYKELGQLILSLNDEVYQPALIVKAPFWSFPQETQLKILSGWKDALEILEKRCKEEKVETLPDNVVKFKK